MVIDQGGHATRALVYDSLGFCICHVEALIKTITRNKTEVEHDPDELLASVFSVIDQVYDLLGDDYLKIKSAGLATQRSSIVCWDKSTGQALSPIISWQDRRTYNNILQYESSIDDIHNVTGLYLNPHYGATKMRWCLDNLPAVKNAFDREALCIAPMASFILFNLLDSEKLNDEVLGGAQDKKNGKTFVIDPANASRTLLMNFKTCQWESKLLKLFSIDKAILPTIKSTKNNFGTIVRHDHTIPLNLCTGDQSAAVYASGELLKDEVFVNAGTGAFILKSSVGVPELQSEKLLASIVYAEEDCISYVIEGTVNGAGRALSWYAEETSFFEYEKEIDKWCETLYEIPIFINAISGIGSPFWISESDSYFVSLKGDRLPDIEKDASHKKNKSIVDGCAEKFIAVLESIVFLIAENIIKIEKLTEPVKIIRLAGGLTASEAFCQKLSNILRCTVVLEEEKEATAKGVYKLLSKTSLNNDGANQSLDKNSDKSIDRSLDKSSAVFHPKNDQMLFNRHNQWQNLMAFTFRIDN